MPFEVVFGQSQPALLPYTEGLATTETVDNMLCDRDAFL
jgi:hypothetical protein